MSNLCFRRAKIKHLAKKSIETGEDCDAIPDCMRQYLAMQAMETGKGFPRGLMGDRSRSLSAYGNNMMLTPEPSPQGKIGKFLAQLLSCYGDAYENSYSPLYLSIIKHW